MGLVGPTTRHGLSCRLGPNLGITTSAQLGSNMGQLGHARTQVGFNMRNLVLCGDNGLARWKYIVGNSGEKRMFSELSLQNWPGLAPAWLPPKRWARWAQVGANWPQVEAMLCTCKSKSPTLGNLLPFRKKGPAMSPCWGSAWAEVAPKQVELVAKLRHVGPKLGRSWGKWVQVVLS